MEKLPQPILVLGHNKFISCQQSLKKLIIQKITPLTLGYSKT